MNVMSTELRMPSSFNIHVFTFEKALNARRERAKTESNVERQLKHSLVSGER